MRSYVLERTRSEFRDLGLKYSDDNMNIINPACRIVLGYLMRIQQIIVFILLFAFFKH
jgi:hypothetical protein